MMKLRDFHTAEQAVKIITEALKWEFPPSYLIEPPPGCNYPEIMFELERAIADDPPVGYTLAKVNAASVEHEEQLVDELIDQLLLGACRVTGCLAHGLV